MTFSFLVIRCTSNSSHVEHALWFISHSVSPLKTRYSHQLSIQLHTLIKIYRVHSISLLERPSAFFCLWKLRNCELMLIKILTKLLTQTISVKILCNANTLGNFTIFLLFPKLFNSSSFFRTSSKHWKARSVGDQPNPGKRCLKAMVLDGVLVLIRCCNEFQMSDLRAKTLKLDRTLYS